jgi:geranylgeranyl pyrophosphate synthase
VSQSALAFVTAPPLLAALERELEEHALHPLSPRAARLVSPAVWNSAIRSALRDFLERPGKEFRGEITRVFYELVNDRHPVPENLPLLVEALHAGSLIVDDIQDESAERRGRPALHNRFGVPLALNAGNWLYFWASDLLAGMGLPDRIRVQAHDLCTRSLLDCHYGQALDLSQRASALSQAELPGVVRATTELKTGSLIALSAGLGALVAGASNDTVLAAYRFGREMGTALQMLDDLSGVISPRKLSKGEEDLKNDRPTWPWAWLATMETPDQFERLRLMARSVSEGADSALLIAELRRLLHDQRRVIHEHLELAFDRLRNELPHAGGLQVLRREIERLEQSYV